MASRDPNVSRRTLVKATAGVAAVAAAGVAATAIWKKSGTAEKQITVADAGGAIVEALRVAFYEPFEKATGIKVVHVAHDSDPTAQLKVLVETNNPVWDVCMAMPSNIVAFPKPEAYFEHLQFTAKDSADWILTAVAPPFWVGVSVFASVLAYRTDKFGGNGPQNWPDFWNVEKFPGRRGLLRDIDSVLEQALMADGVPPDQLYPLTDEKVERGFRALERIKPHINVWWSTGAQLTQILQSGEVDMAGTWASQAYAAIAGGAPCKLSWNQGTYSMDGWCIVKGTEKLDLARQFIRFTLDPKQQAIYSSHVLNGPTNKKAFDSLSAQRAAMLPSSPENLKGLVLEDYRYWGTNKSRLSERYLAWILK